MATTMHAFFNNNAGQCESADTYGIPSASGKTRPKALILSASGLPPFWEQRLHEVAALQHRINLEPLSPKAFIELAAPYQFLALTRRAVRNLDRDILQSLPMLRGVSVYSTGLEWIDIEYLRSRRVHLMSLPGYCTNAVAETTIGLILMSAHKLHLRYLKSTGQTPQNVSLRGFELRKCTVGIIGCGRIGRLLAQKLAPLCRRVLVNDVDEKACARAPETTRTADKNTLLAQSDFVVVCASQFHAAQQILEPQQYRLLGCNAAVINVGRTSLLDHRRLLEMTRKQLIRSYIYDDLMGMDDLNDSMEFGKIIPTGHTAWYTDEAMRAGTSQWIQNLVKLCSRP